MAKTIECLTCYAGTTPCIQHTLNVKEFVATELSNIEESLAKLANVCSMLREMLEAPEQDIIA